MPEYKILSKNIYSKGNFSIIPIRYEDRLKIMNWRNEQMYHLRQSKRLSESDQEHYFETVVQKLYDQSKPNQILFSYLNDDTCIGYGGLVHINWIDRNAEVSFIMDTLFEKDFFDLHWSNFLSMLEEVAFKDLKLHKIYAYAFDLRPHLYDTLKNNDFFLDAELNEHCFFNDRYIDVVIYSKIK